MDYLVHYGHSCIVPVDQTVVTMLYIHVAVKFDVEHLVETIRLNFAPASQLALMGTVQFTSGIQRAASELQREFATDDGAAKVPQVRPLGVGEVLGCTSPQVPENTDAVIFVCDGRFHLESAMIQNPYVKQGFFRYDPFYRTLTREGFEHAELHQIPPLKPGHHHWCQWHATIANTYCSHRHTEHPQILPLTPVLNLVNETIVQW